jgi:hypothetical protein
MNIEDEREEALPIVSSEGASEAGSDALPPSGDEHARPIESLPELVRAVYDGSFARGDLRKQELERLRKAPDVTDGERAELLAAAEHDISLARTRQLLMLALGVDAQVLNARIREFARQKLACHPLFSSDALAEVIGHLATRSSEREAVALLVNAEMSPDPFAAEGKAREKLLAQCRSNAIDCTIILMWSARKTPISEIAQVLGDARWSRLARKGSSEPHGLRAILGNRDPIAALAVLESIRHELHAQGMRAESAFRQLKVARESAESRQLEIDRATAELDSARQEVDRLQALVSDTETKHRDAMAKLENRLVQLQGRVLDTLVREVDLLENGLTALGRSPPKIHVMIDHASRAIAGLRAEMSRLKEEDQHADDRV